MQLVGKFEPVIDVLCFTRYVLLGAVMGDATANAGLQVLLEEGGQLGLGRLNLVMVRHKQLPASQDVAFAIR